MYELLIGLGVALFAGFLLIVFRGAPYVPTHKARALKALDVLDLPQGATLVDLGSGDGVVLKLAAQRGLRAVGYELNPFLCVISYIRCWPLRKQVTVQWRDFWLSSLPPTTDAVFIFLAGPYMKRFAGKIGREAAALGRPVKVVSYGFLIPGHTEYLADGDLHFYLFKT